MAFLTAEKVKTLKENTGGDKRYLNISKLPDAKASRFRFFGEGVTGFVAWTVNRKPLRWEVLPEVLPESVKPDDNGDRTAKFFLAGICWDYEAEMFRVIEITQKGIIGDINKYVADEDFGDPSGYDITITRTGSGLDTKYDVLAKPPKPISDTVKKVFSQLGWNLSNLFEGRHPWSDENDDADSTDD
jgi:hypothetical protein